MQQTDTPAVLSHHQAAAAMWGLGGKAYDRISFCLSDALAHAAQRLCAGPGDEVLDVATGTGWSARNAAAAGARVTGVDISRELLYAARELSAHVQPPVEFRRADAEALPFGNARFDRVISTFGAMFAAGHRQTAAELGRVCKPGGRLVLTTWAPAGSVQELFAMIGKYNDAPAPPQSPLAWGDPEYVQELLGGDFKLTFERGANNAYHDNVEEVWDWYARGFGPIRQLTESLEPDRLAAFRRDFDVYHADYITDAGLLHIKREYLVTIGQRR